MSLLSKYKIEYNFLAGPGLVYQRRVGWFDVPQPGQLWQREGSSLTYIRALAPQAASFGDTRGSKDFFMGDVLMIVDAHLAVMETAKTVPEGEQAAYSFVKLNFEILADDKVYLIPELSLVDWHLSFKKVL